MILSEVDARQKGANSTGPRTVCLIGVSKLSIKTGVWIALAIRKRQSHRFLRYAVIIINTQITVGPFSPICTQEVTGNSTLSF